MASYDTWHNLLTGISQGSFDKIYIKDANGNFVDLLTLCGAVTSVSSPLSLTNGILSLNTSGLDNRGLIYGLARTIPQGTQDIYFQATV